MEQVPARGQGGRSRGGGAAHGVSHTGPHLACRAEALGLSDAGRELSDAQGLGLLAQPTDPHLIGLGTETCVDPPCHSGLGPPLAPPFHSAAQLDFPHGQLETRGWAPSHPAAHSLAAPAPSPEPSALLGASDSSAIAPATPGRVEARGAPPLASGRHTTIKEPWGEEAGLYQSWPSLHTLATRRRGGSRACLPLLPCCPWLAPSTPFPTCTPHRQRGHNPALMQGTAPPGWHAPPTGGHPPGRAHCPHARGPVGQAHLRVILPCRLRPAPLYHWRGLASGSA